MTRPRVEEFEVAIGDLAEAAIAPAVMVKGKALLEESATQGATGV